MVQYVLKRLPFEWYLVWPYSYLGEAMESNTRCFLFLLFLLFLLFFVLVTLFKPGEVSIGAVSIRTGGIRCPGNDIRGGDRVWTTAGQAAGQAAGQPAGQGWEGG